MATVTLRPSSDSTIVECLIYPTTPTTHFDKVDEETPNDDTDYVYANTTGVFRDLFNKLASGIPTGSTINSVTIYNRIRCIPGEYGEYGYCYTLLRSGTTDAQGGPEQSSVWATVNTVYNNSPFTGVPWTIAEIDAMLIGTRLYGIQYGEFPTEERCSTVWIVVDYTAPVVAVLKMVGDGLTCVVACLSRRVLRKLCSLWLGLFRSNKR